MNNLLPLVRTLLVSVLVLAYQPTAQATAENVDALIRTALMLDSHPNVGGVVFRNHCANCHGTKAAGSAKGIPALAGQRQAYLVKQFADFAEEDRDGKQMHRVIASKALNDPQTWLNVAAFINSLPPSTTVATGNGKNILLGEAIFREQCSSCHEQDARGDDDGFVPSLRNQHYSYLLRQMHALAAGHRRNVDSGIDLFLSTIKEDEKEATADFLSRLTGSTKDRSKMRQNGVVND